MSSQLGGRLAALPSPTLRNPVAPQGRGARARMGLETRADKRSSRSGSDFRGGPAMLLPPLQPPRAPRPPPRWTLERLGPFQTSSRADCVRICSPEGTHSPRNQPRSPFSLETPIPPGHSARGFPAPEACEPRPSALGTLGLRPSAAGRHSGPEAFRCPRPQLLSDGGRATAHWPRPGLSQAAWMTRAGQTDESPASGARAQA